VLRLPFHQAFMLPTLVFVVLRPAPYFCLKIFGVSLEKIDIPH